MTTTDQSVQQLPAGDASSETPATPPALLQLEGAVTAVRRSRLDGKDYMRLWLKGADSPNDILELAAPEGCQLGDRYVVILSKVSDVAAMKEVGNG